MTQIEQYGNYPLGFNLTSILHAADTTLTPPSYTGWPTSGQMRIQAQDNGEYILITDLATHPWPISRAVEGTAPAIDHAVGCAIAAIFTVGGIENLVAVDQAGVLVATGREINFPSGATVTQVGSVIQVDLATDRILVDDNGEVLCDDNGNVLYSD